MLKAGYPSHIVKGQNENLSVSARPKHHQHVDLTNPLCSDTMNRFIYLYWKAWWRSQYAIRMILVFFVRVGAMHFLFEVPYSPFYYFAYGVLPAPPTFISAGVVFLGLSFFSLFFSFLYVFFELPVEQSFMIPCWWSPRKHVWLIYGYTLLLEIMFIPAWYRILLQIPDIFTRSL